MERSGLTVHSCSKQGTSLLWWVFPPVEEAATEQFHTECPPGMGAWGPEFEMYCDAKYTPSVHQMVRGLWRWIWMPERGMWGQPSTSPCLGQAPMHWANVELHGVLDREKQMPWHSPSPQRLHSLLGKRNLCWTLQGSVMWWMQARGSLDRSPTTGNLLWWRETLWSRCQSGPELSCQPWLCIWYTWETLKTRPHPDHIHQHLWGRFQPSALFKAPRGSDGKKKICLQCGRTGFDLWVGKIHWRRA